MPLALQSATIDLTQIGFTASVDSGPWTWASAVVHGFGNVNSRRDTGFGIATAGYMRALDGVLSEISYYWTRDQGRIVPKAAFEYVRAQTGSLQEIGGLDPVTATGATVQRGRLLIGAEIGHYWIFDGKILDLSGYGKLRRQCRAEFLRHHGQPWRAEHYVQGIGEGSTAPIPAPRRRSA